MAGERVLRVVRVVRLLRMTVGAAVGERPGLVSPS